MRMSRAGGLLVNGTAEEHLRIGALEDAGDAGAPLELLLDDRPDGLSFSPESMPSATAGRPVDTAAKRPVSESSDSESTTATDHDVPIAPAEPPAKVARTAQLVPEQPQFYTSGGRRRCRAACMCCWERKLRCSMLQCGACLNCVERNRMCIPRIHNRRPSQLVGGRRNIGPDANEVMTVEALTSMGAGSPSSMPQPVPAHGGMMYAPYAGGYAMGGAPCVVGIPVSQPHTQGVEGGSPGFANGMAMVGNGPMMMGAHMAKGQMGPMPLAPGQVQSGPMNMYYASQFMPAAFHQMMMRQANPHMPGQMMQGYAHQPFAPGAPGMAVPPSAGAQHAQMMPQMPPHMLMQPTWSTRAETSPNSCSSFSARQL